MTFASKPSSRSGGPAGPLRRVAGAMASIPAALPLLALRIALAVPFFRSGLTKWDGFLTLSDGAVYLFTQEFRLHVFGHEFPFPAPLSTAALAGAAEIVLPLLLVLGLGTRFAALGVLVMTAVIQLTIPEGWANFHLPWAAMALALVVHGGGSTSIDHLIARAGQGNG